MCGKCSGFSKYKSCVLLHLHSPKYMCAVSNVAVLSSSLIYYYYYYYCYYYYYYYFDHEIV